MSVTLPSIAPQTVLAGAPLNLPLAATGTTDPVSYSVSVSNSNVTATVPTGNTFLDLRVDDAGDNIHGDMIFELYNDLTPNTVAEITNLANSGYYSGKVFHRVISNFMIQGGSPTGDGTDSGLQFDDEFNANLQFTSSGVLAMANSGNDTNGHQFFITAAPYQSGDFKYTIFGFLVEGDSVRQQIANVPVHGNGQGENIAPNNTVTITSATIITDNTDGVLRLSAPRGGTGSSVVTVTATDTVTHETSTQQFTATVAANTTTNPPFLGTIAPIQTSVNTPVTLTVPATNVDGSSMYFDAVDPSSPNLTYTVDHSTGSLTVTPSASLTPGVYSVKLLVAESSSYNISNSSTYDSQVVPIYVSPAAPTAVKLMPASDTGISNSDDITNLNNSAGKTLQFEVDGVLSAADVQLFADGTLIGEATASGTSVVITTINTSSTVPLTDGTHSFTATQTLSNTAVNVGNLQTTVNLASAASSSLSVIVDATPPQFSFTPITTASVGVAYNCQAAVIGDLAGTITYSLTQAPTGMTVSAAGLITWTPPTGQTSPVPITLQATDKAGNTSQQSFSITLVPPNNVRCSWRIPPR